MREEKRTIYTCPTYGIQVISHTNLLAKKTKIKKSIKTLFLGNRVYMHKTKTSTAREKESSKIWKVRGVWRSKSTFDDSIVNYLCGHPKCPLEERVKVVIPKHTTHPAGVEARVWGERGWWGRGWLGEPKFRFRSGELNWVNFAAEPNFPPTLSSRLKPSFSLLCLPVFLSSPLVQISFRRAMKTDLERRDR